MTIINKYGNCGYCDSSDLITEDNETFVCRECNSLNFKNK